MIIGGTGELGRKVVDAAISEEESGWSGNVIATYFSNAPHKFCPRIQWRKLDCSDHKSVRELVISNHDLACVLYCAVPRHRGANEKKNDRVQAGIVDDVMNAAEAVVMVGAKFVAVSTDLVFDGKIETGERYDEKSRTSPPNPYGVYKAMMEKRLMQLSGKIIIARTSLILTLDEGYVGKGMQFVLDCVNGKHGEIELFTDEWRNMSFSDDLGRAMVELGKPSCSHVGLIHMVSDEVTNRWELANLLVNRMGMQEKLGKFAKSGLSSESGLNRPLNCALSTELRKNVIKTPIRGITERLG